MLLSRFQTDLTALFKKTFSMEAQADYDRNLSENWWRKGKEEEEEKGEEEAEVDEVPAEWPKVAHLFDDCRGG